MFRRVELFEVQTSTGVPLNLGLWMPDVWSGDAP